MDTKEFTKLTKKERKVAVAKDVIKQLKNIVPREGVYFRAKVTKDQKDNILGEELKDYIPELTCEVCALGACFLSVVNIIDNFKITQNHLEYFYNTSSWSDDLVIDDIYMFKHLKKAFSSTELILIESAFEKKYMAGISLSYEKYEKAVAFGRKYKSAKSRLKAIMENIVKNETFVP